MPRPRPILEGALSRPGTENADLGDTFLVYPGPDGPVESIRGQVFAESLQDVALLQTLGADPNGKLLAELKDFDDFPKDEAWLAKARGKLLKGS